MDAAPNPLGAVIRREYLQQVRSWWFILVTVGEPILLLGLIAGAAFFASESPETPSSPPSLAVADGTQVLYAGLAAELQDAGYRVREERWRADVAGDLRPALMDAEPDGLIVLEPLAVETGEAAFYTSSRPSQLRRTLIHGAVTAALTSYRLQQRGLDPAAILPSAELQVELVGGGTADYSELFMTLAMLPAVILFIVILIYGAAVMRATLEEKTNGIVEVVVASMKPWHLMFGKIIGVGAVGFTQLAVWVVLTAIIAVASADIVFDALPADQLAELRSMLTLETAIYVFGLTVLFLGLFVCGFFIWASLYAAVGAMCSNQAEMQQAQLAVTIPMILPGFLLRRVMDDPDSTLSVAMSLVPLFTPILIWPRIAAGAVPPWQYAVAFILSALAVVAVAWAAGRIYTTGILMTGKRPTLPELWRWLREA